MSETLRVASLFIINTLFQLYLFVLVIRLILVWIRSDYFNPLTQFVVKMSDVIVRPTRRILPNIKSLETATLTLIFIIELVKFFLIALISVGIPNPIGIVLLSIADIFYLIIETFTYAIILQAILSFIQPMSPMTYILSRFTSPIMSPLERIIPPINGINITPIPALLLLQLVQIVLVSPLMMLGQSMIVW